MQIYSCVYIILFGWEGVNYFTIQVWWFYPIHENQNIQHQIIYPKTNDT